jgi:hypothetical protein
MQTQRAQRKEESAEKRSWEIDSACIFPDTFFFAISASSASVVDKSLSREVEIDAG